MFILLLFLEVIFFSTVYTATLENNDYLTGSPNEIKARITKYLYDKDLRSLRITSKNLREIIDSFCAFDHIFPDSILLKVHEKEWKTYFENYTPFEYCLENYSINFKTLEDFLEKDNQSIFGVNLIEFTTLKKSLFRITPTRRGHSLGKHFNKKQLARFFTQPTLLQNEGIVGRIDVLSEVSTLLKKFEVEPYYTCSILKRIIRFLLIEKCVKEEIQLKNEFARKTSVCYGPERAKKMKGYVDHLYKVLKELQESARKAYTNEDRYATQQDINTTQFQICTLLLSVTNDQQSKYLSTINPTWLLQNNNNVRDYIKRPSKIIKLYENLYALDKDYSKQWFVAWFDAITRRIDTKNESYSLDTCELQDLFLNECTPCPLFECINDEQTIYDILKNRNYQYYYYDT